MGHHLLPLRGLNLILFNAQQAYLEDLNLVYIFSSFQIKLKSVFKIWKKKLSKLTFDLNRKQNLLKMKQGSTLHSLQGMAGFRVNISKCE